MGEAAWLCPVVDPCRGVAVSPTTAGRVGSSLSEGGRLMGVYFVDFVEVLYFYLCSTDGIDYSVVLPIISKRR